MVTLILCPKNVSQALQDIIRGHLARLPFNEKKSPFLKKM